MAPTNSNDSTVWFSQFHSLNFVYIKQKGQMFNKTVVECYNVNSNEYELTWGQVLVYLNIRHGAVDHPSM